MSTNKWFRALCVGAMVCGLFASARAEACSVCGCGDPLVSAGDARPLPGNLRLALEFETLTATARSDDEPDATESLSQQILRPVLVYSPTPSLNLVLQAPITRKAFTLTSPDGVESTRPIGLGDADLGARWFFWQNTDFQKLRVQNAALFGGSSLPTGRNDVTLDGERIDEHAQLGTGSFGPYLGALYAFHQDPWNLSLEVGGRVHTTNLYGYQYGTALVWSVAATLRPWERFAFVLGVDGRYAARDTSEGELQQNTGGLVVAATPGVAINLWGQLWLHARAQVPVFTHLFGEQSVGPVFTLGLQYSFAG